MLIDWFTVVAQAVNFLILVWLMKRFLYQPILRALDAREQRIAGELADADAQKRAAEQQRADYQRKNAEFDAARESMYARASSEAQAEHRRLFEAVRGEAEGLRVKLQTRLDEEYAHLREEIARRTQAEAFALARQALADLCDSELEQRIAEVFIRHLNAMEPAERQRLAALQRGAQAPLVVKSAFEPSAEQRNALEQAVKGALGKDNTIRFETVPGLIGGIELLLNGEKIAWSLSDQLASLEKELAGMMRLK